MPRPGPGLGSSSVPVPPSSMTEKDASVGLRPDMVTLLTQEAEGGWNKIGVVVGGPSSLCDDVRVAVVAG